MPKSHKQAKEAFVSNLTGGSVAEICLVTLVAPASVLLWSALQSRLRYFSPYTAAPCLVDFLLNAAAILFAITLYSSNPLVLNALLLLPAVGLLVTARPSKHYKKPTPSRQPVSGSKDEFSKDVRHALPVKPFLTTYRGTMMVITCAAILAVDFKAFPRRFGKVENWGTSIMDLGVGSFVFAAGLVAARPILKERIVGSSSAGVVPRMKSALRHSLPLLVLGLVRLYSVKGLDYAEHVSEYGVHWNFFFTLAFLPPFVALFDTVFRFIPSYAALAMLVAVLYQVCLDSTHLTRFILLAPRTDLLSKNREGIFSFFGYLSIFLTGQATGMSVLPRAIRQVKRSRDPILRHLAMWSIAWSVLFFLCTNYRFGANLRVSRRLANLPYVLGVAAFNCWQLLLFYVIELSIFPDTSVSTEPTKAAEEASSRLLRAFNRNGLALFLLANLLTGLVNLALPTLYMNNVQAIGVLLAYLGVLSAVALLLDIRNISIKL